MTTIPPLDPAITYFVGVDHGAGPDTTKAALVNVEPDGKVVVIGEADNTIAGRFALLRALSQTQTAPASPLALTHDDIRSMARLEPAPMIVSVDTMRRLCEPDPLMKPIPPAALAAFDAPIPVKKNRAARRKEARRGR